jgi:methionine synthase II (cobalamin-independent)
LLPLVVSLCVFPGCSAHVVIDPKYSNRDVTFLRANTDRKIKITLPGAFTMAQQAQNDFYKDEGELAMAYAAVVNEEIKDLFAAGADVVQIDEPYLQARPEKAKHYGLKVLNHSVKGITGTTAVHIGFGYAAIIQQRPSAYSVGSMCGRFRSKPHSRTSIARCSQRYRQRQSFSGSWISRI